ncbi:MAG: hypothetical protein AAF725_23530 [Acidobacteriota bacterium]
MSRRTLLPCALLLLLLPGFPSASAQEEEPAAAAGERRSYPITTMPSRRALEDGNGHFAIGELELALERYHAGYDPVAPHPTLVYNLATTFHHLDRLPEAILWYRRGDAADPWLEENLWLARRSLGTQNLPLTGAVGWFTARRPALLTASVALAWLSLGVALLGARLPRAVWATSVGLALCLYLVAVVIEWKGPREAVLMEDCLSPAGELPAGSEVWVWPASGERRAIAGVESMSCGEDQLVWIHDSKGSGR